MEYEGSIGFVMRKMNFFIADFHVKGLLMAKNMSGKKIPSVTRRCRWRCCTENLHFTYKLGLKSWKAEILAPGVFWANLMYLVLGILKFRFLKVATKERFLQFCCLGHKD
jgi:hypothetical protein